MVGLVVEEPASSTPPARAALQMTPARCDDSSEVLHGPGERTPKDYTKYPGLGVRDVSSTGLEDGARENVASALVFPPRNSGA